MSVTTNKFDYTQWLPSLKTQLAISELDTSRDDTLLSYLEIAHKNIWECFYRLNDFNSLNAIHHDWFSDAPTKLATLHLAATYFTNPDENVEAQNVVDNRMVMRLLGSRMNYGLEKELKDLPSLGPSFYTKDEIDHMLANYSTLIYLNDLLNSYTTKTQLNNEIQSVKNQYNKLLQKIENDFVSKKDLNDFNDKVEKMLTALKAEIEFVKNNHNSLQTNFQQFENATNESIELFNNNLNATNESIELFNNNLNATNESVKLFNNDLNNLKSAQNSLISEIQTNKENIDQINQELDSFAKLGLNNTFEGNNVFNNSVVVGEPIEDNNAATKSYVDTQLATKASLQSENTFSANNIFKTINVRGANNNRNNILIDNFNWQNKNVSSIKLVKNGNSNLLQIEAYNNDNQVFISAPSADSFHINNLSNPTNPNQATNKSYVDTQLVTKADKSYVDGLIKSKKVLLSSRSNYTTFIHNSMRSYRYEFSNLGFDRSRFMSSFLETNASAFEDRTSYYISFTWTTDDKLVVIITNLYTTDDIHATYDAWNLVINYW